MTRSERTVVPPGVERTEPMPERIVVGNPKPVTGPLYWLRERGHPPEEAFPAPEVERVPYVRGDLYEAALAERDALLAWVAQLEARP